MKSLSGELNRLSKEGKWQQMGDAIDDEILDTFAVISESPQKLANGNTQSIWELR